MPKVSVYLPDELYQAARARGLSLSSLTQEAIARALGADANVDWLVRARRRAERGRARPAVGMATLMAAVRNEFGT